MFEPIELPIQLTRVEEFEQEFKTRVEDRVNALKELPIEFRADTQLIDRQLDQLNEARLALAVGVQLDSARETLSAFKVEFHSHTIRVDGDLTPIKEKIAELGSVLLEVESIDRGVLPEFDDIFLQVTTLVNDESLTALNKHIDLKIDHIDELNAKEIKPKAQLFDLAIEDQIDKIDLLKRALSELDKDTQFGLDLSAESFSSQEVVADSADNDAFQSRILVGVDRLVKFSSEALLSLETVNQNLQNLALSLRKPRSPDGLLTKGKSETDPAVTEIGQLLQATLAQSELIREQTLATKETQRSLGGSFVDNIFRGFSESVGREIFQGTSQRSKKRLQNVGSIGSKITEKAADVGQTVLARGLGFQDSKSLQTQIKKSLDPTGLFKPFKEAAAEARKSAVQAAATGGSTVTAFWDTFEKEVSVRIKKEAAKQGRGAASRAVAAASNLAAPVQNFRRDVSIERAKEQAKNIKVELTEQEIQSVLAAKKEIIVGNAGFFPFDEGKTGTILEPLVRRFFDSEFVGLDSPSATKLVRGESLPEDLIREFDNPALIETLNAFGVAVEVFDKELGQALRSIKSGQDINDILVDQTKSDQIKGQIATSAIQAARGGTNLDLPQQLAKIAAIKELRPDLKVKFIGFSGGGSVGDDLVRAKAVDKGATIGTPFYQAPAIPNIRGGKDSQFNMFDIESDPLQEVVSSNISDFANAGLAHAIGNYLNDPEIRKWVSDQLNLQLTPEQIQFQGVDPSIAVKDPNARQKGVRKVISALNSVSNTDADVGQIQKYLASERISRLKPRESIQVFENVFKSLETSVSEFDIVTGDRVVDDARERIQGLVDYYKIVAYDIADQPEKLIKVLNKALAEIKAETEAAIQVKVAVPEVPQDIQKPPKKKEPAFKIDESPNFVGIPEPKLTKQSVDFSPTFEVNIPDVEVTVEANPEFLGESATPVKLESPVVSPAAANIDAPIKEVPTLSPNKEALALPPSKHALAIANVESQILQLQEEREDVLSQIVKAEKFSNSLNKTASQDLKQIQEQKKKALQDEVASINSSIEAAQAYILEQKQALDVESKTIASSIEASSEQAVKAPIESTIKDDRSAAIANVESQILQLQEEREDVLSQIVKAEKFSSSLNKTATQDFKQIQEQKKKALQDEVASINASIEAAQAYILEQKQPVISEAPIVSVPVAEPQPSAPQLSPRDEKKAELAQQLAIQTKVKNQLEKSGSSLAKEQESLVKATKKELNSIKRQEKAEQIIERGKADIATTQKAIAESASKLKDTTESAVATLFGIEKNYLETKTHANASAVKAAFLVDTLQAASNAVTSVFTAAKTTYGVLQQAETAFLKLDPSGASFAGKRALQIGGATAATAALAPSAFGAVTSGAAQLGQLGGAGLGSLVNQQVASVLPDLSQVGLQIGTTITRVITAIIPELGFGLRTAVQAALPNFAQIGFETGAAIQAGAATIAPTVLGAAGAGAAGITGAALTGHGVVRAGERLASVLPGTDQSKALAGSTQKLLKATKTTIEKAASTLVSVEIEPLPQLKAKEQPLKLTAKEPVLVSADNAEVPKTKAASSAIVPASKPKSLFVQAKPPKQFTALPDLSDFFGMLPKVEKEFKTVSHGFAEIQQHQIKLISTIQETNKQFSSASTPLEKGVAALRVLEEARTGKEAIKSEIAKNRKSGAIDSREQNKLTGSLSIFTKQEKEAKAYLQRLAKEYRKSGKDIGVFIQTGLALGLSEDIAEKAAGQLVDDVIKVAEKNFGIASPSKVFRAIGKFIVKGLALGFGDDAAVIAAGKMADGVIAITKNQFTKGAKGITDPLAKGINDGINEIKPPKRSLFTPGFSDKPVSLNATVGELADKSLIGTNIPKKTFSAFSGGEDAYLKELEDLVRRRDQLQAELKRRIEIGEVDPTDLQDLLKSANEMIATLKKTKLSVSGSISPIEFTPFEGVDDALKYDANTTIKELRQQSERLNQEFTRASGDFDSVPVVTRPAVVFTPFDGIDDALEYKANTTIRELREQSERVGQEFIRASSKFDSALNLQKYDFVEVNKLRFEDEKRQPVTRVPDQDLSLFSSRQAPNVRPDPLRGGFQETASKKPVATEAELKKQVTLIERLKLLVKGELRLALDTKDAIVKSEAFQKKLGKVKEAIDDIKGQVEVKIAAPLAKPLQKDLDFIKATLGNIRDLAATAFAGFVGFQAFDILLNQALQAKEVFKQFQSTEIGINLKAGGIEQGAKKLEFLRNESDRLGLNFLETADSYSFLAGQVQGSKFEGSLDPLFTSLSETATALQFNEEKASRLFTAFGQIFGKGGKLSAEELRQQLGELGIPLDLFREALGFSKDELGEFNKQLDTGKLVLTEQSIGSITDALKNRFGPGVAAASQSLQAIENRFGNAANSLRVAFAEQALPTLTVALGIATSGLKLLATNSEVVLGTLQALGTTGIAVFATKLLGLENKFGLVAKAGLFLANFFNISLPFSLGRSWVAADTFGKKLDVLGASALKVGASLGKALLSGAALSAGFGIAIGAFSAFTAKSEEARAVTQKFENSWEKLRDTLKTPIEAEIKIKREALEADKEVGLAREIEDREQDDRKFLGFKGTLNTAGDILRGKPLDTLAKVGKLNDQIKQSKIAAESSAKSVQEFLDVATSKGGIENLAPEELQTARVEFAAMESAARGFSKTAGSRELREKYAGIADEISGINRLLNKGGVESQNLTNKVAEAQAALDQNDLSFETNKSKIELDAALSVEAGGSGFEAEQKKVAAINSLLKVRIGLQESLVQAGQAKINGDLFDSLPLSEQKEALKEQAAQEQALYGLQIELSRSAMQAKIDASQKVQEELEREHSLMEQLIDQQSAIAQLATSRKFEGFESSINNQEATITRRFVDAGFEGQGQVAFDTELESRAVSIDREQLDFLESQENKVTQINTLLQKQALAKKKLADLTKAEKDAPTPEIEKQLEQQIEQQKTTVLQGQTEIQRQNRELEKEELKFSGDYHTKVFELYKSRIQREIAQDKLRVDQTIQAQKLQEQVISESLANSKVKAESLTKSLDQQREILESFNNVRIARENLRFGSLDGQLNEAREATEVFKRIREGSSTLTKNQVKQLKTVLEQLTGTKVKLPDFAGQDKSKSLIEAQKIEQNLLLKRQQIEDEIARAKFTALNRELQMAKALLALDLQRQQIAAQQSVRDAQIQQSQAQIGFIEAQGERQQAEFDLSEAQQTGTTIDIQRAELALNQAEIKEELAFNQVSASSFGVQDAQSAASQISTLIKNAIEANTLESESKIAQFLNEDKTRERSQTLELIDFGAKNISDLNEIPSATEQQRQQAIAQADGILKKQPSALTFESPKTPERSLPVSIETIDSQFRDVSKMFGETIIKSFQQVTATQSALSQLVVPQISGETTVEIDQAPQIKSSQNSVNMNVSIVEKLEAIRKAVENKDLSVHVRATGAKVDVKTNDGDDSLSLAGA